MEKRNILRILWSLRRGTLESTWKLLRKYENWISGRLSSAIISVFMIHLRVISLFPNLHFVSLFIPQRRYSNFFPFFSLFRGTRITIIEYYSGSHFAEKIYFYSHYEYFSISLKYFLCFMLRRGCTITLFAFPSPGASPPATLLINISYVRPCSNL